MYHEALNKVVYFLKSFSRIFGNVRYGSVCIFIDPFRKIDCVPVEIRYVRQLYY